MHTGKLDRVEASALGDRLNKLPGVIEAVVISEEQLAYLKLDSKILDETALDEILQRHRITALSPA